MASSNQRLAAGWLAITLSCSAFQIHASSGVDQDWLSASNAEVEAMLNNIDTSVFERDHNPYADAAREDADAILKDDPQMQRLASQAESQKLYSSHDIFLFASQSLEMTGLSDMLALASEDPRVVIVFRGVPEGMKIDEGMRELQRLAAEFDPVPSITLDPTLFDKYNVDVVPTIVSLSPDLPSTPALPTVSELLEGDDGARLNESAPASNQEREIYGRVEGLTDPAWMERKFHLGEYGDFGRQGPIEEIQEPNLIEVMQQRTLAIDWESQKDNALDNFWRNQRDNFLFLPPANADDTRRIDARVTVTRDLTDDDGNVIVAEGTTYNPMDIMPFTMGIVIIDPLDQKQIAIAESQLEALEARDDVMTTMLLVTRFDVDEGWDGYTELTDHFDKPAFLLTPDIVERFEINRVPSVVTGDETHFIVSEFASPPIERGVP